LITGKDKLGELLFFNIANILIH